MQTEKNWDAGELGCGELIAELLKQVKALGARQTLRVLAKDAGAAEDIPAWCRVTGHTLRQAAPPYYVIERKER